MKRPVFVRRTQDDGLQDELSWVTGISCPAEEDRTRQEFGADVEMRNILARYQPVAPSPARYGVQRLDADMTEVFQLRDLALQAYQDLPEDVRRQYPSWELLAAAMSRGEIQPGAASAASAEPAPGSASDSAPVQGA